MRNSPDSIPVVLVLTAFVLMFLGETSYQRLAETWILVRIEPYLSASEAEWAERFSALAVAGLLSLWVTAGLYLHLRRRFAQQLARVAAGLPARPPAARRLALRCDLPDLSRTLGGDQPQGRQARSRRC